MKRQERLGEQILRGIKLIDAMTAVRTSRGYR